jgi:predicted phage baseplate assembly protein
LAEAALDAETQDAGYDRLDAAALRGVQQIWFADPERDQPAATVADDPASARVLEFDGKPPALGSGDPVILQTARGYATNRIERIEKDAGSYRLTFATDFGAAAVTSLHGAFAATLRPTGHHVDPTSVASNEFALQLDTDGEWPALLQRGRRLILESASGAFAAFAARIESSNPRRRIFRIDRAASELAGIARGDLIIRANVVDAGHGETKPVKVLGSGDASAPNQRFVIDLDDVSHVRDASMPGGVRADLKVEVEHEIYSQVATLRDSEPADPHYVVRITETGTLELEFGDGRHGRRLPSGTNNVLATFRRGSGPDGNLPAGALSDIVKKHPAVDSFLQRIVATGGDDREALDQIRESAPGRLAAMDRAISVADYQQLAQRFQGVWHAAAFEQPNFRRSREAVRVVIVPAGGGPLGMLADDIRGYLQANGLPSADIVIEPFVALPVEIWVHVRVDPIRFDPREVEGRVGAAVLAAFDLRRRRPGQPVYRSEVTRVVENTDGVSNSDVVLFRSNPPSDEPDWDHAARGDDDGIWAAFPRDNQVIYAASPALITVTTEEAAI